MKLLLEIHLFRWNALRINSIQFLLLVYFSCFISFSNNANAAKTCYSYDFEKPSLGSDWDLGHNGSINPFIADWNGSKRAQLTDYGPKTIGAMFHKPALPTTGIITVEFNFMLLTTNSRDANGVTVAFSSGDRWFGGKAGSMGYAPLFADSGFKNGWIGVGLDSYGQFSNPIDGRTGGPGFREEEVVIRGSHIGNYKYITSSGKLYPWVFHSESRNIGQKFKITIDSRASGKTMLGVERDIFDGHFYNSIISPFNITSYSSQAIPSQLQVTFIGANGGDRRKPRFIDDVKICYDPIPYVDHLELSYSANPLTCRKEVVTIKACKNSSCSETVPYNFNVSLSSHDSDIAAWENSEIALTNGIGTATLVGKKSSPIWISANSSDATILHATQCRKGSSSATTDCYISFANTGFLIEVPDRLAGKPTGAAITAVRKSDHARICVPLLSNTTKTVKFWSEYISPSSPLAGTNPKVRVNGGVIGRSESAATDVSLNFNFEGRAYFTLNYLDAGKLGLHAKFSNDWLNLYGSGNFVRIPEGLCIKSATTCPAANALCPIIAKAGEEIDLDISAHRYVSDGDPDVCDNPITPNYAHNNIVLSSQLLAPVGGVNGTVGTTRYNHTASVTGTNTVSQSISEVGVFAFTAKPPNRYLNSSAADAYMPKAYSKPIGRFVPDIFEVSEHSVNPACGTGTKSFSYMAQPHKVEFKVTAKNTANQPTKNYISDIRPDHNFAKSIFTLVAENNNDGNNLTSRLTYTAAPLSWELGEVHVLQDILINRRPAPHIDGPFARLDLGVVTHDWDGETKLLSPNMNPNIPGDCHFGGVNNCTAVKLGEEFVAFGRMTMDNAYGPNHSPIKMNVNAEFWSGADWVSNHFDNCTSSGTDSDNFNPTLLYYINNPSLGYKYKPALVIPGQSINRFGSGALVEGKGIMPWTTSSIGAYPLYLGTVTAPLIVPNWLKFYWNWSGVNPNLNDDPRASATFGRVLGNTKSIYWHELF